MLNKQIVSTVVTVIKHVPLTHAGMGGLVPDFCLDTDAAAQLDIQELNVKSIVVSLTHVKMGAHVLGYHMATDAAAGLDTQEVDAKSGDFRVAVPLTRA